MSNNLKDIDINTYYFFDDIVNINIFDPNRTEIDEKLCKNNVYYIRYVTVKDSKFVKINSVNPLYFIIK